LTARCLKVRVNVGIQTFFKACFSNILLSTLSPKLNIYYNVSLKLAKCCCKYVINSDTGMTCLDFIIVSIFVTSHKEAVTVAFVGLFATRFANVKTPTKATVAASLCDVTNIETIIKSMQVIPASLLMTFLQQHFADFKTTSKLMLSLGDSVLTRLLEHNGTAVFKKLFEYQHLLYSCQWQNSNPRSQDYESRVLPLCQRGTATC
jgi:hypothetical protein